MGTQILLSSRPADAFSVAAGPGDVFSGAAVGFKPQQDCRLSSVGLLLRGYTGANGQDIKIELLGNNNLGPANQPAGSISNTFSIPAPNDGSVAEFTFNLSADAALSAGSIYWLLVYGGLNNASLTQGSLLYWVAGGNPAGNAAFIQSLLFVEGNFQPSTVIPGFTVNVAV